MVTTIGLLWRNNGNFSFFPSNQTLQALVISEGNVSQNPIVVIARQLDQTKHLIVYEVNIQDDYRFTVRDRIEIGNVVVSLKKNPDQKNEFWALENKKWISYNLSLMRKKAEPPLDNHLIDSQVLFDVKNNSVVVRNKEVVFPTMDTENLRSIHPLNEEKSTWLFVFDQEIEIVHSQ
ncbi:hypothetical protein [Bacillus sp. 2205SS5-2]|uniref:hypothetical protein n=1 Tax=Bacillus sp. 2205SS5-2 TaxID=3109031 RepID=UPI0030066F52